MPQWADYSGGRPPGVALKAAGFSGVLRYVGLGSGSKRINAAEYRELTAAGVQVLLVAELGTGDAWGTGSDDDYARGRANAQAALQDARTAGVPDSVGIAAAADAHATTQWQINDAVAYTRGFRDVLGLARTGFYGFSETLNAVHDAGVASWFWRCGSQPNAQEKTWVNFWQRNTAPTVRVVSGISCDINEQYNPVGAHPAASGSTPVSGAAMEEEDVLIVPPGTDDHVNLIVKGKTELYVACSFGRKVTVHSIDYYGPTGPDPKGTGVGGHVDNGTIDPNRPGPLAVPKGAVMATLRYTADHSFGVGTA
jgi:hypothetical protein